MAKLDENFFKAPIPTPNEWFITKSEEYRKIQNKDTIKSTFISITSILNAKDIMSIPNIPDFDEILESYNKDNSEIVETSKNEQKEGLYL